MALSVSQKNNPDAHKQDRHTPSAHHLTKERPVCIYQSGVHSQYIQLFNIQYWAENYTDHCTIVLQYFL